MDDLKGRFASIDDDPPKGSWLILVFRIVVTMLALALIGLGIWAIGGAIYVVWALFRNPEGIAYFARYFLDTTGIARLAESGGEGLAHYAAWVMVILLMLLLGKLGAWAITSGAQLLGPAFRRQR